MNYIVLLWFAGFLFFLIRFSGSYLYIFRLKTKHTIPLSTKWQEILDKLRSDLGIQKSIKLVESALVRVPMVLGHFKPVIILPLELITHTPANQIEAILVHELAHIKRNDFLINLFRTSVETIFFYHPIFWWISSRLEEYRENRCDDLAINYCGSAESLQKALLGISLYNHKKQHIAAALYKNENQLLKRIKRMKTKNQLDHDNRNKFRAPIFFLAIIIMAITGTSFINNQSTSARGIISPDITIYPAYLVQPDGEEKIQVSEPIQHISSSPDSSLVNKNQNSDKLMSSKGTISLQLDDDGNLLSASKNGEALSGEELRKYEEYTRAMKQQEQQTQEMKVYQQKLEELQKSLDEASIRMHETEKEYQQMVDEYMALKGEINHTADPETWSILENQQLLEKKLLEDQYYKQQELAGIQSSSSLFDEYNSQLEKLQDQERILQEQYEQSAKHMENQLNKQMLFEAEQKQLFLKEAQRIDLLNDLHELEMKELEFEKQIHQELIIDQVIEDGERLTFVLSNKRLVVNGKKQNAQLHKKYLDIYTRHTDKPLSDDTRVIIED